MSQDAGRTEKPTAKRLGEFRNRGDVAHSRDVIAVGTLCGGVIAGSMYAASTAGAMMGFARQAFSHTHEELENIAGPMAHAYFVATAPTAVGALAFGLVFGLAQLGWPMALKWPSFSVPRLFSAQTILQSVSPGKVAWRSVTHLAKFAVVVVAAFVAVRREYHSFMEAPSLDARTLLQSMFAAMFHLVTWAVSALAVLAVVDYLINRKKWMSRIMMTKSEIRGEHREQEGDPMIKSRRRRRMRELVRRRIAAVVPTADVVMVNPTEYAVALRYRAGRDRAPMVLAKGRGRIAEMIRNLARKSGVPIVADPPLTRMIHKLVPEGKEIPPTLYKAVAEVLAYVYRLRRRRLA